MNKAFLSVSFLLFSGCSSVPLTDYQAKEIHYNAEPDTLEEFYELVSEKSGKENVQRIKDENAVAITVLGLDALEQVEFTLWRICKEQTTNYTDMLDKGRETAYLSLRKPLEKSDRPVETLPVDLGPTWQEHDEWLEQKLPGQYFGPFDGSAQGVCLTDFNLGIEFGYSSLILKENEEAKSSHEFVVLVTPGEHYENAIANAWNDPTLRLYQAIRTGDVESAREAVNDGAKLDRTLVNVSTVKPLSEALVSNSLEIVQLLLDAGTNSLSSHDHQFIEGHLIRGNISAEMFMLIGNHQSSKKLFERWINALAAEFGKTDADRRRERQQLIDILVESLYLKEGIEVCRPIDGVRAKGVVIESDDRGVKIRITEIINRPDREVLFEPGSDFLSTTIWRSSEPWKPC